jgi:hypothetical protein
LEELDTSVLAPREAKIAISSDAQLNGYRLLALDVKTLNDFFVREVLADTPELLVHVKQANSTIFRAGDEMIVAIGMELSSMHNRDMAMSLVHVSKVHVAFQGLHDTFAFTVHEVGLSMPADA